MDGILAMIEAVEAQERTLMFDTFTNDEAWALGSILVGFGRERGLPITVDITRGAQQLFHAALAGTAAHNDVWVARKTRTVCELGTSSFLAGLRATAAGSTFEAAPWINPLTHSGHGGAFPITIRGVGVVGSITVSGLAQADDHALAVEAIEAFLARD